MEEDTQDGPFAVWQMFNAPTMVLFNNLEHAEDGLDRLLTSILKLSGDFSEVLVPRPTTSKYPESYYCAFNTWLLGRLFYIWSVKELNRIHILSKDAQLKILHILGINGASFYENIHSEYCSILTKLIHHYKEHSDVESIQMTLENFRPEQVDLQNVQLNLDAIFVEVKDIETCKGLIDLTLQLLSESIPIDSLHIEKNKHQIESVFTEILFMLENYSIDLKLISLNFYLRLLKNYNETAVFTFQTTFPEVYTELINCLEAIVKAMDVLYDKGEVNTMSLESFNTVIQGLLEIIAQNFKNEEEALLQISTTILLAKSKVFNKELKLFCLSLSKLLHFPQEISAIENRDASEIEMLSDYYYEQFKLSVKMNDINFKISQESDSFHYSQIQKSIQKSMNACHGNIDALVISYHLNRCWVILRILQRVQVLCQPTHPALDKDLATNVMETMKSLIRKHAVIFTSEKKVLELHLNTQFGAVFPYYCMDKNIVNGFLGIVTSCYVIQKYFTTLKHILIFKMFGNSNETPSTELLTMFYSPKVEMVERIALCPLILMNKLTSASKLISEVLLPAFLAKNEEVQLEITKVVPVLACISFSPCQLVITTAKGMGHTVFSNGTVHLSVICPKCHSKSSNTEYIELLKLPEPSMHNEQTTEGLRQLYSKFLSKTQYRNVDNTEFWELLRRLCNHYYVFEYGVSPQTFNEDNCEPVVRALGAFFRISSEVDESNKSKALDVCINMLVTTTKQSLEKSDHSLQTQVLNSIKAFGLYDSETVVLPATKLLVYFIMHPLSFLGPKAVVYLREVCESHALTPNQVYHRFKKDYCRLFVECSLYNGKDFAIALLRVVRAFGFVGYRDFISKDVHHFLPYLIGYSPTVKEVPLMIEEIASLVQCSVSDFLIERFPHIYVYIYLRESKEGSKKCYELIERLTKSSVLNLIKKHFRVILTEFLLQYCCNPEKVLNACRYLACHDPDVSTPTGSMSMSTTQIADFLNPKFLGVLAYFDHKLVNAKVALSVKQKALRSFPDIMQLMGVKYLTPLRFKVLATLRSALPLTKEFPKIVAEAWGAFIHNIDTMSLGPLLSNLAVSLMHQFEHAPQEINKIFQYMVLSNENLLSTHISDLFFLEGAEISEKIKMVIKRHVRRTQPEGFLDKIKWYLQHLNQEIPMIKAYAFSNLDKLLKSNRTEIHKAIFGGKSIDSVIVELIDALLLGCKDSDLKVSLASGSCLGQLGAIEAGHLPRQYVQPDRSPFAFSIGDNCFAATALVELCRAFQYEKDTTNMDCYALTIQEMLKIYDVSPTGSKKDVWDSFPEHMHQIMHPLLSSRYILAYPSQPKKAHPLFGSIYATTFLEWAYNWAGQLIPLIESESIRELLRTVHPSMRRDVRTLFLFLPYVLLHAIMSKNNPQYLQEEILAVIGLENFETTSATERAKYKMLRHIRMTPSINTVQAEEGNQSKCCKTIYTLFDFLNRWLLEWCNSKQRPMENENYKAIASFMDKFDKLTIARGNFLCGELERALQYLELYCTDADDSQARLQEQLPFLAELYALLDEPDAVAGILSIKRSEPSLKELILGQVVTGRLQDAALCYERLAQEGQLDRHSLQGMIDCYLGLDQPFTAYRLLSEHESDDSMLQMAAEPLWRLGRFEQLDELVKKPVMAAEPLWRVASSNWMNLLRSLWYVIIISAYQLISEHESDDSMLQMAAEPLWRLGRFEQLDELVKKPVPQSRENWGLLMGKVLLSYRSQNHETFVASCNNAMSRLLAQMDGETKGESALRSGYQSVLGLHIVSEAGHAEEVLRRLKTLADGDRQGTEAVNQLLDEWRRRLAVVQTDVRTVEPLLRLRRIFLQQAQELLAPTHSLTANRLKRCVGELWLQSAKHARKAGIFQQSYMYILNAEEYEPEELFIEKAKMYWARGQHEHAFTTLRRGLEEAYPQIDQLTQEQKKICAKAKLLIAQYNDETTNVDVDVNIGYYKEAVDVFKQWEKSLVCLGAYYEKVSTGDNSSLSWSRRLYALNNYGKALQCGHKYLYQSMPRMLSIWLDVEVTSADTSIHSILAQMTEVIKTYSERLPLYLYLTAFSQIISRICHPVKEVYQQLKAIIVKLILAYPQHTLWMMLCVMKSGYPQRIKRCNDVFSDPRLKEPRMLRLINDFTQLAEKLIELCNKPIPGTGNTTTVSALVRTLPRLLAGDSFSHIMMPFQEFCKVVLPSKAAGQGRIDFVMPAEPPVYIAGIEEHISILPSLQKPRKVTLKGSDGKSYIIMLKPRDDLRKDYRLMEFNGVVNRFLQDAPETRRRRLYIRTYSVLPLNEECGLIEWVHNLVGLRPILMHIYKQKGIHTSNRELKEMMCSNKDSVEKKRRVYEEQLLPKHPPVFQEWFRRVFSDPYGWYQARSAYIRTTAVMSMVGYILGLGDRHGENISFDSTNGDTVHVDFNCLFNKGEAFEWPERVPFRLTHNMEAAMGPLKHEGMYRKSCEAVMRVLRSQTAALMSVIGPFVYDPLVAWGRGRPMDAGERTNEQALQHLLHIRQRLNGMVRTKNKQLSLSLSPEGQVEHLIVEATSIHNLCQMYIGWGPFL